MRRGNKWYIILSVLFSSLLMSYVDGVIAPTYFVKSCIKICLFLIVPLGYFLVDRSERNKALMRSIFVWKRKDLVNALLLGMGVYVVIMVAYMIFRNFIDLSLIQDSLASGMRVTAENFVYVAVYISFVNSLLEEFFFRGYAYMILKSETNSKFACVFSAILFAMYHVGMTSGWFSWYIYVLAMLGLFVGGCIFNVLNDHCGTIYPSWLVHMFANFAINTVGFILFGFI
ncbi:MAG: CPBP family intramembrane metalloprotease [Erysipelotrichaceae bacterium]|nr:CPBP family intramembrane metalloprotease [Erysipelotrichaceae bacterium]